MPFDAPLATRLIDLALDEDVGRGDVTTLATVLPTTLATARIDTREPCIVAGLPVLERVFARVGTGVTVVPLVAEGEAIVAGTTLARLRGPARVLLVGERLALNLLQRMCAIATCTRRFVAAVAGTGARIADTRKTAPGQRLFDKYAVRIGGGVNHRTGLDAGILIKENHIAAAGSITTALRRVRAEAPFPLRVHVEVRSLAEVQEALAAGAEGLLLDNMNAATLRQATALCRGRVLTEASGGVTLGNVAEVAAAGVDIISVGALTHSAGNIDLTMLLDLVATGPAAAPGAQPLETKPDGPP